MSGLIFNEHPVALVAELDGYWKSAGGGLRNAATWLGEATNSILLPLAIERGWNPSGVDLSDQSPFIGLSTEREAVAWTEAAWLVALDGFAGGRLRNVQASVEVVADGVLCPVRAAGQSSPADGATQLRLEVPVAVFGGRIPDEMGMRAYGLWEQGVALTLPATGHVTVDAVTDLTAHELDRGLGPALGSLESTVRGYHWATLLGPSHIAALGGEDAVRRDAPVNRVTSPRGHAKDMLILTLTEDINEVSDSDLARLKSYLATVLVSGAQRFGTYVSPPVRAIGDDHSVTRIDSAQLVGSGAQLGNLFELFLASLEERPEIRRWPRLRRPRSLHVRFVGAPDLEGIVVRMLLDRPLQRSESARLERMLGSIHARIPVEIDSGVSFVSDPRSGSTADGTPSVEWWIDAALIRRDELKALLQGFVDFAAEEGRPYRSVVFGGTLER